MAYSKQTWTDNVTPVDGAHMAHIEDGLGLVDTGGAAAKGAVNGYASLDANTRLPDAQLPLRLGLTTLPTTLTNANLAITSGWYVFSSTATNMPAATDLHVNVIAYNANFIVQQAFEFYTDRTWKRVCISGTWGAWQQTWPTPYSTTLPASPVDGQEAILVDSLTAPTYTWRFRFNAGHASDAYKWEFIGGSQCTQYEATTLAVNVGATLGAVGPVLTVPRAGFYTVRHVSFGYNTATSAAYLVGCWVTYPGAVALSGSDSPNVGFPLANAANVYVNENLVFVPSAGQQICIGVYSAHASTFSRQRTHSIIPVRVI